jgi:hypothetical protein
MVWYEHSRWRELLPWLNRGTGLISRASLAPFPVGKVTHSLVQPNDRLALVQVMACCPVTATRVIWCRASMNDGGSAFHSWSAANRS